MRAALTDAIAAGETDLMIRCRMDQVKALPRLPERGDRLYGNGKLRKEPRPHASVRLLTRGPPRQETPT